MSDLFEAPLPTGPHSSRNAPETSARAADAIRPHLPPIRERVLSFALSRGSGGFIDEELIELGEDERQGDRSIRPRRTELTDEGHILDSGQRRLNSQRHSCVVWIHRDFAIAPPPIQERAKPEKAKPGDLRSEGEEMALELARYAASFKAEGRLVHARIARAADIMAALARA